jgi:integrase
MKLSDVKKAAAGKADFVQWCEDLPGFGLRVRNNRGSWIVQYQLGGKSKRLTLGSTDALTYKEARTGWIGADGTKRPGAERILLDAKDGHDYSAVRARRHHENSKTLGAIIGRYLEDKRARVRDRTFIEIERYLTEQWRPLHDLPLASINREAVAAQVSVIAKNNGNTTANRARSTLSALYAWAIGEGIANLNPVWGSNKREEGPPRDRVLTDAEIVKIWNTAPDSNYGRIIKLLLLTACRREEIGGLKWSEINDGVITLPKHRAKNGVEHVIPLPDLAIDILAGIERHGDYVFGARNSPFSGWSKAKPVFDAALNIAPWVLHDLRRTAATKMADLGVQPHIVEAVLNHVGGHKAGVAGIYNKAQYFAEKKAALATWASHIRVILAKADGANVVTLSRA